jgi:negative regulator of flagellin synthesis FlgM
MKVTSKLPNATQSAEAMKSSKLGDATAMEGKKAKSSLSAAELGQSARVDVSARAQEVRKAKELATPSNGIDEAKVARLQKLIDKGEYKVDAEAIADRMIDEHSKMPL